MIDLDLFIAFFVFITGACIGSFLNVVALRGLSDESIVLPPSHCPKCNKKLNWYTNIPIISYIFLKGKCEFCKEHISLQYPIVEFLNAALWVAVYFAFGFTLKTLFMCAFISMLLVIAATDFKERVVIDAHTYVIIALGVIYSFITGGFSGLIQSLIGIAAAWIIFELLAKLGFLFGYDRAFGEGDTLIGMGIGAFLGWKFIPLIILLGGAVLGVLMLPLLIHQAIKEKKYKMALAYSTVIIAVILTKVFEIFHIYDNFISTVICLLVFCAMILWALVVILADLKKERECEDKGESNVILTPPFGPGLVAATIFVIFFQDKIVDFVNSIKTALF